MANERDWPISQKHPSTPGRCQDRVDHFPDRELLCRLVRFIPAICVLSRFEDGRILEVNQRFLDVSGFRREEVVGKTGLELEVWAHPEDRQRFFTELGRQGHCLYLDTEFKIKDGRGIPSRISAQLVRAEGETCVLTVSHDISESRQARLALERSLEMYRLVVENANEAIAVAQDGIFKYFNPKTCEIIGYPPELVGSRPFLEFIHPEDRELVARRHALRLDGENPPQQYSFRILDRQGNIHWIAINVVAIQWEGRPATLIFMDDITDQEEARLALARSEERYRILVENLPYGLFIAEIPSLRFLYVNQQACLMFGYSREETYSKTVWDFCVPAEHQRLERRLQARLRGELGDRVLVYTGRHKEGSTIRCEVTVSIINYQGKQALMGFVRDISQEEILQKQLQHSQKMEAVGTLAGGVAHEFNNILMAIRGYCQILQLKGDRDDARKTYLYKIEQSTQRAAELTNTMLNFSRQESGKKSVVEVNQVMAGLKELLSRILPPSIELCLEQHPRPLLVEANANELEQVILNLAVNARDAMPAGGTITLRTRLHRADSGFSKRHTWARGNMPYAEVTVSDNGRGMDEVERKRIFEPFFTTKEPGQGTGLGLSLAYTMINNHDGNIEVESRPGQGSTFRVFLPAPPGLRPPAAPEPRRLEVPRGSGQLILVADDDPSVREITREALEAFGYRVVTTTDGKQALASYRRALEKGEPPALVIMDLAMPRMDGRNATRHILELDPAALILIATGYTCEGDDLGSLSGRVAGVIRKPFDLSQLLETLNRLLDPS